jgi:hypothetical protein
MKVIRAPLLPKELLVVSVMGVPNVCSIPKLLGRLLFATSFMLER